MTTDECLQRWDEETTLRLILARGVSLDKWKAFALHAGAVDGRKWTYEEISREWKIDIGKSRARFSQVMGEVESALARRGVFSPHDPKCRRAAYNFLRQVRPLHIESIYRIRKPYTEIQNAVFEYQNKVWRCCGESTYDPKIWLGNPLELDFSSIVEAKIIEYGINPRVIVQSPKYAVLWGASNEMREPYYRDHVATGRFTAAVFNCDGEFYEMERIEEDASGMRRVVLRPLECRVIRQG